MNEEMEGGRRERMGGKEIDSQQAVAGPGALYRRRGVIFKKREKRIVRFASGVIGEGRSKRVATLSLILI